MSIRTTNPLILGGIATLIALASSCQSKAVDQSSCRLTRAEFDAVQMGLEQSYAFDKALRCKNVVFLGRWRNRDFTTNDRWQAEMKDGSIANFTSVDGYLAIKMITEK